MTRDWTDRIVGARMSVDSDFSSRIDNSQFSRQEWGLIMTAVEFRIEHAEDPGRARLVADTSRIEDIMPEVERAAEMQGQMGGRGGNDPSRGGVLGSLRDALGFGGDAGTRGSVDPNRVAAATSLVEAYTTELQSYLEKQDRWEEVRLAASESE